METERRIEKLLRAFAKKRKADAGAPLELHPATRRLLQDEVARATKKAGPEKNSLWQILFASKPRLAFALSMLVILGVSGLLVLPALKESKPQTLLAGNKRETKKLDRADMPAPTFAPATPAPAQATPPVTATAEAKFDDREDLKAKTDSASGIDGVVPLAVNTPVVVVADDSRGGFGGGGGGGGNGGGRGGGARASFGGVRKETSGTPPGNESTGMAKSVEEKPVTIAMSGVTETMRSKDSTVVAGGISSVNRDARIVAPKVVTSPAAPILDSDQRASSTLTAAKTPVATVATGTTSFYYAASAGDVGGNTAQFDNADKAKLEQSRNQVATQRFYRLRVTDEINGAAEKQMTPLQRQSEPTTGAILDSFAIEQDGDKFTVVDQDGSKYSGFIQVAAINEEKRFAEQPPGARRGGQTEVTPQRRNLEAIDVAASRAPAGQPPLMTPNYFFKVTGTNRSLNQAVVFSGNLMANTNMAAFQQVSPQVTPQLPLLNSRISGRAAVGGKSEIEINAAPVSP